METEHKTAIDKLSNQLNKIFNYFPHIEELLNFERFCRAVGFGTEMIRKLFDREEFSFKGELYSHEYKRKYTIVHSVAKVELDQSRSGKYQLNIDGMEVYDWFRHEQKEFLHSIGVNSQENNKRESSYNIFFGINNSYVQIIIYLCITIGVLWTTRN